jgi:hypothetical protein
MFAWADEKQRGRQVMLLFSCWSTSHFDGKYTASSRPEPRKGWGYKMIVMGP